MRMQLWWLVSLWACSISAAQDCLPHTQPLTLQGDLSAQMVAGIDRFLTRETEQAVGERLRYWRRDFSSVAAYDESVRTNRERLRTIIGAVDTRLPATALEFISSTSSPVTASKTDSFTAEAVRWPVFEGVYAEGLWLRPRGEPVAFVVALPDADQTPELVVGLAPGLPPERQFARRLAENGCEVLVPVLVNRQDDSAAYGPADVVKFPRTAGGVQPAAHFVHRYGGRLTGDGREAASRFLSQWPEGPQIA